MPVVFGFVFVCLFPALSDASVVVGVGLLQELQRGMKNIPSKNTGKVPPPPLFIGNFSPVLRYLIMV